MQHIRSYNQTNSYKVNSNSTIQRTAESQQHYDTLETKASNDRKNTLDITIQNSTKTSGPRPEKYHPDSPLRYSSTFHGYVAKLDSPRASERMQQTERSATHFSENIAKRALQSVDNSQTGAEGRDIQIELELGGLRLYELEQKLDSCLSSSRKTLDLNCRFSPNITEIMSSSARKSFGRESNNGCNGLIRTFRSLSPKNSSKHTIKNSNNLLDNLSPGEVTVFMSPKEQERFSELEERAHQIRSSIRKSSQNDTSAINYINKENLDSSFSPNRSNIHDKVRIATVEKPKALGKVVKTENFAPNTSPTPLDTHDKYNSSSMNNNKETEDKSEEDQSFGISNKHQIPTHNLNKGSSITIENGSLAKQGENAFSRILNQDNSRKIEGSFEENRNTVPFQKDLKEAFPVDSKNKEFQDVNNKGYYAQPRNTKLLTDSHKPHDKSYNQLANQDDRNKGKEFVVRKNSTGQNHGVSWMVEEIHKEDQKSMSQGLKASHSNYYQRNISKDSPHFSDQQSITGVSYDLGSRSKEEKNFRRSNNVTLENEKDRSNISIYQRPQSPGVLAVVKDVHIENKTDPELRNHIKNEVHNFLASFESEAGREDAKGWLKAFIDNTKFEKPGSRSPPGVFNLKKKPSIPSIERKSPTQNVTLGGYVDIETSDKRRSNVYCKSPALADEQERVCITLPTENPVAHRSRDQAKNVQKYATIHPSRKKLQAQIIPVDRPPTTFAYRKNPLEQSSSKPNIKEGLKIQSMLNLGLIKRPLTSSGTKGVIVEQKGWKVESPKSPNFQGTGSRESKLIKRSNTTNSKTSLNQKDDAKNRAERVNAKTGTNLARDLEFLNNLREDVRKSLTFIDKGISGIHKQIKK